ncbi:MAG: pilus assembly protein [Bifidobacteriaceae bacterium]|jgi:Flp pilus assembly protein TadG|nr:pilus assembly protein [Bifidobacteriaceae bacterium]
MQFNTILRKKSKGSVTAEFAVIMPVVVVIIGIILSVFAAVSTTIRCQNTANHIAQQLVAKKYATGATFGVDVASLVHSGVNSSAVWDVFEASPYVRVVIKSDISIGPVQIIPISVTGEAYGYIV